MYAITHLRAGARGPFAVPAFRYEDVDASLREGAHANGQVFMPKDDDGGAWQGRTRRPTQAQGLEPQARETQQQGSQGFQRGGSVAADPSATRNSRIR